MCRWSLMDDISFDRMSMKNTSMPVFCYYKCFITECWGISGQNVHMLLVVEKHGSWDNFDTKSPLSGINRKERRWCSTRRDTDRATWPKSHCDRWRPGIEWVVHSGHRSLSYRCGYMIYEVYWAMKPLLNQKFSLCECTDILFIHTKAYAWQGIRCKQKCRIQYHAIYIKLYYSFITYMISIAAVIDRTTSNWMKFSKSITLSNRDMQDKRHRVWMNHITH